LLINVHHRGRLPLSLARPALPAVLAPLSIARWLAQRLWITAASSPQHVPRWPEPRPSACTEGQGPLRAGVPGHAVERGSRLGALGCGLLGQVRASAWRCPPTRGSGRWPARQGRGGLARGGVGGLAWVRPRPGSLPAGLPGIGVRGSEDRGVGPGASGCGVRETVLRPAGCGPPALGRPSAGPRDDFGRQ